MLGWASVQISPVTPFVILFVAACHFLPFGFELGKSYSGLFHFETELYVKCSTQCELTRMVMFAKVSLEIKAFERG